eukprot:1156156-Pelagomonas_calceolata.AAC.2
MFACSHHLVTIPPPSWICAAHRNNTKVVCCKCIEQKCAHKSAPSSHPQPCIAPCPYLAGACSRILRRVGLPHSTFSFSSDVLGTFITEWAEGSKVCKQLFSSRSMAQQH